MMRMGWGCLSVLLAMAAFVQAAEPTAAPSLERQVMPLLKARCVKCHGPGKREAEMNLATAKGLARGGKEGPVVVPGKLDESSLWTRVDDNEMPPKEPLEQTEKDLLRRWIVQGAPGLPKVAKGEPAGADHWAFAPAVRPQLPALKDESRVRNAVDRFVLSKLEAHRLSLAPEADRATLIRRVAFDLTGLPPTPDEIERFLADRAPDAYERMVERYLGSPHYGERWGKYWLDAAGYADSNGYFNADSDRPLAYRYRDYVIRSWNDDKPLDRFVQEQIAGDELAGFRKGAKVTPEVIDQLVATHYLRNAPDGTGESDGNADELRADRYAVLEGTTQVLGSSLLGMTFQCARCHDHKFEPITQKDYYSLYAILWPAYDLGRWVKPQERIVEAALPGELAAWEARSRKIDAEIDALKGEFTAWARQHRLKGTTVFQDSFDSSEPLAARWSATAPGDDAPAAAAAVKLDSADAPGAVVRDGTLRIVESGAAGNRWLSTRQSIDWTPNEKGAWVQVTFDLVDTKLAPGGTTAERVGYYVALHDYNDNSHKPGGNILIDGNPAGGAEVHVDYPGTDSKAHGAIGTSGYRAGHNFGVRITNQGKDRFLVEQLVDWAPESKTVQLSAADLPDGGFGFEYCCNRSFIVDNVLIESGGPDRGKEKGLAEELKSRQKQLDDQIRARNAQRGERPGRIAWLGDLTDSPTDTHLLRRGLYHDNGAKVAPAPPAVLCDPDNPFDAHRPAEGMSSTGRRLAFARWLTRPGSRPAALLARVLANRIWQNHFGTGLVITTENLGYSGSPPTNPELLEFLAAELARQGWRPKALHRLILMSSVYRQSSAASKDSLEADHDNLLLSRFPVVRLDAEAARDGMLAASGELDARLGGPYVPTTRAANGEGIVEQSGPGARRRSVYLQQRRTQVMSLLDIFDAPSIVTTCTRRIPTATPLQSLSLLNSDFILARANALAQRLGREAGADSAARIERAFILTTGRPPNAAEQSAAQRFLETQPAQYAGQKDAAERSLADFCQMLLASNAFLYVE